MLKPIYFLILCLVVIGCEENPVEKSFDQMLTDESWIVETKTVVPPFSLAGFDVSDILIYDTDSVRNLEYSFMENGVFQVVNSIGEVRLETTWSLDDASNTIFLSDTLFYSYPILGDVWVTQFQVISLSQESLHTEIPVLFDETNYIVTINFRKR